MFNRKKPSDAAKRENFAKGSFIGYDLPAPKRPQRAPPRGARPSVDAPKSPRGERAEAPKSPRSLGRSEENKKWDEAAASKSPAPAPRTLEPPVAAGDRIRSTSPSRSKEGDAKVKFSTPEPSSELDGPVLEVLVSGGGPCGLIFSCLLAGYAGDRCHIRVYEARVKSAGGKIVWKDAADGNTRREQVVTLQNDVTRCLPKEMRDYLFKRIDEEAWPSSRNIPIREVEDQMLEYAQMSQFKGVIEVIPEQLTEEKMKELNGTFDILVGADGSRSFVRSWAGMQTRVLGTDKAMGVAYECTPAPLSQATNILLTVSQTRYLLNSHKGERGFLNLRLEESEWEELAKEGRMEKRPFPIAARNSMLWNVILDGLRLFDIPEKTVKAIMPIEIQLTYAAYFMTEVDNFKTTVPTGMDRPRAFVIGDAAFRVHFWPGRGLNSAIKAAIALARAAFWAYDKEHKGGKRLRPVNNWDFSRFEGFMAMLRAREEEGRSRPVTEISVEDANQNGLKDKAKWVELREKFRETMVGLRDRLEDRPDWPHPHVSDKDIDDVFQRLSPLTINMLHHSGTWPLAEMAGEEVDPRMLFQNPSGETAESRIVRQNIAKPQASRGK